MTSKSFGWLMVSVPATAASLLILWAAAPTLGRVAAEVHPDLVAENARLLLDEGRRVFRYETFGDEAFWGDTLKLHQAIAGAKLGGVGPGVSPKTALSVGLKVDVDAVPAAVAAALKAGKVDLDAPASTLVLLKANAVVGMCHPCSPNQAGTRTRDRRSASMISRRIDRRTAATAPPRGLMTHAQGGFYHDGRFADLMAVVEHYNQFLKLGLTDAERRDLIEYLKSL